MRKKSAISRIYTVIIAVIIVVAAIVAVYYATLPPPEKVEVEVNIYTIIWRLDEYNEALGGWLNETLPNVKANFIGLSDYDKEITTLFVNAPESVDICLSRGPMWRQWAASGWLTPVETFPGMDELKTKMYPSNVVAGSWNNQLYAVPWYTSIQYMFYNKRILEEAGFDHPPETWEELVNQCLTIKEKGLCEYPLAYTFIPRTLRLERLWRIISATMTEKGENMHWDEDFNPLFLDEGSAGYEALQFMHDIIYEWKIASDAILTLDWSQEISLMMEGEIAFCAEAFFNIKNLNDPEASQEAGNIDVMLWPGNEASMAGDTGGFVATKRAMEKGDDHKNAVQEIYKYICGPEWKKELDAIPWFLDNTYPSVNNDPEVIAEINKYGNATTRNQQIEYSRSEAFELNPLIMEVPWATEFDTKYVIPILHDAVRGAVPIGKALNDIHQGFLQLKEEYGFG